MTCKISLESIPDCSDLSPALQASHALFSSVFGPLDGSAVSQRDRLRMSDRDLDTPGFTYGEIGEQQYTHPSLPPSLSRCFFPMHALAG